MITLCIRSIASLSCIRRHDRSYDEWCADISNFPARDSTPVVSSNRIRLPAIPSCPKFVGLPRNVTKFHRDSWTRLDLVRFGSMMAWDELYLVLCCLLLCTQYYIYVLRNVECPKPISGRKYMYMLCFQKILKSIVRLTLKKDPKIDSPFNF